MGWGGWLSLSRVGSGDGVSCGGRGRGDSRWRVSAGASTSIGWCWLPRVASVAWSRGGGRGWCGGGAVDGGGGGGGCCAGWGSGRPCGSCGCCACAPCGPCGSWLVVVPGCGWEAAAWASGWGCGPYVMGCCWWMVLAGMECGWGGCWWWWGAPTRPWCCLCACAAPRGSMGVYRGSCVVGPCSGGGGWCWTAWWWC